MKIICGTGHRANKLCDHGWDFQKRINNLALDHLREHRPDIVISGMALGWDQALARAAVEEQIPFHAYIPFPGQSGKWPEVARIHYQMLKEKAALIHYTDERGYTGPEVMLKRNTEMVNATTQHVVALWDGSRGGTQHCVIYANKNNVPVINLWDKFMAKAWNPHHNPWKEYYR